MLEFHAVCARNPGRNVHLVQNENGTLLWKETKGSSDAVSEFVVPWSEKCRNPSAPTCIHERCAVNIAVECSQRVCLLLGEPGIGKTSFLCSLAEKQREKAPEAWAVVVKLLEHVDLLADLPDENADMGRRDVASVLSAAAGVATPASSAARRCLEAALFHTGAVHVFVDGVDEVMPAYRDKTLRLLELLVETKAARVWVAARPEVDTSLRRLLPCGPAFLRPLSREEQLAYLRSKWSFCGQRQSLDAFDRVTKELLGAFAFDPRLEENFQLHSHVDRLPLLGVPFNLRMVVEAFEEDAKTAIETNSSFLPARVSQLELFQRFVENNRKRYKDRYGPRPSLRDITYGSKAEDDVFLQLHQNYAMLIWTSASIPLAQKQFQESVQKYKDDMSLEKSGILWQLEDGRLQFAHYTFIEYFAATWLFENRQKSGEFKQLFEAAYKNPHSRVMVFLDLMLSEGRPFHKAIIENDTETLASPPPLERHEDLGGRSALHVAAAYGRSGCVNGLLEVGCDLSRRDSLLQWTALQYASATANLVSAETLLEKGASENDLEIPEDILPVLQFDLVEIMRVVLKNTETHPSFSNITISINRTSSCELTLKLFPLHVAAYAGSKRVVQLLLLEGVDVNSREEYCETPLHAAAIGGHKDIAEILVSRDAHINCRGVFEFTPLHYACERGHVQVVQLLLSSGADVFQTALNNTMPIHLAAQSGNKEVFDILFEKLTPEDFQKAIHSTDNFQYTPLHRAALKGHNEVVNFLIENGTNFNLKTEEGHMPIHLAVAAAHEDTTEVLLRGGADIHGRGQDGFTPLHYACNRGHLKVVQLLVSKGADVLQRATRNEMPIHFAASKGHKAVVELLLQTSTSNAELEVNSIMENHCTPLHRAAFNGHKAVVEFLLEVGANINLKTKEGHMAVHIAASEGHERVTDVLLRSGADIHCRGQHGRTPLHYACEGGHVKVVQLLLSKDADVSLNALENSTPLHVAALKGYSDVVDLLVNGGAEVDCCDSLGRTPLFEAAKRGHAVVVQFLLSKGAGLNTTTVDGWTPLLIASCNGHSRVVVILLHAGARVNVSDCNGRYALHLAAAQGHREIVQLLLSRGADAYQLDSSGLVPI